MYSQLFSPYNLYACAKQSERRNSGLSKDDFVQKVESYVGNSINEGTYKFKIKKQELKFGQSRKLLQRHMVLDLDIHLIN